MGLDKALPPPRRIAAPRPVDGARSYISHLSAIRSNRTNARCSATLTQTTTFLPVKCRRVSTPARIAFVLTLNRQTIAHASLRALPGDGPLRGRFRLRAGRGGRGRKCLESTVCRVSAVNCPIPSARSDYPAKSRKSHRRDTTRIPTQYRRADFPNIRAVNLRVAASRIAGGDRSPRTGRYPSSYRSRPPPPQGHIPACARSRPGAGKSLASLDDPAA